MGWTGTECYEAEISRQSPLACLGRDVATEERKGQGGPEVLLRQEEAGDTNTMPSEEAPEEG